MSNEPINLAGAEFLTDKTEGLYEPAGPKSLGETAERSSKNNRAITDAVPYFQDWREAAHRLKTYAIANLDKLLVEFERNIAARGRHRALGRGCRRGQRARAANRPRT